MGLPVPNAVMPQVTAPRWCAEVMHRVATWIPVTEDGAEGRT